MVQLRNALRLLSVLLISVALVGCDSGGNGGGGGLGDSVTLEVEGSSDVTVSWSTTFFYNQDGGFCSTSSTGLGNSGSPPIDETIEPGSSSCTGDGTDPSDFDGVQITLSTQSSSSDLTVTLLSDGNQIDQATEPEEEGTFDGFWLVEGGDIPDLSDF
jgi:hypothetical protein